MKIVEIAVLAVLASPVQAQVAAPPPAIVTNADAHTEVQADRAQLLVAVETRGATAAAAASENSRLTRAALDTLRAIGLSREQLGTFGYNVQPQYIQAKLNGYIARNTVRVDIRKVDDVGKIIDAALAGGATTIGGLQFTASNTDSARRDALARATAQARGDAEVVARAAGGTLGPLLELTTSGDNGFRPVAYARAAVAGAVAAPTPIDAGPITVTINVSTRWQFIPGNR